MAEASPLKELMDSDTATAAAVEKLLQIRGKEHKNNSSSNNNKKMMTMMKREKAQDSETENGSSNNNSDEMTKREKVAADLEKKTMTRMKVQDSEINRNRGDQETLMTEVRKGVKSFGPKKQKYRSLRDIYKATEPVSTTKVPDSDDSENDQNKGEEVTSATEVRKEAKSFGHPKKQKYRSLRDIYKATEPVSSSY